jgi:hypothetical protein
MTPNQHEFVKSGACQKRVKRHESLSFKGIPFDTIRGKSSVGFSLGWSKARA